MRLSKWLAMSVVITATALCCYHTPHAKAAPAATDTTPFINARTLIIVRHADTQKGAKKAVGNQLAPLAVPGVTRAGDLAVALKGFGITSLVASDCVRTQQTLQKLSDAIHLKEDITLKHDEETEGTAGAAVDKSAAKQKEALTAIQHLSEIAHPADVIVLCYHHTVIPQIMADLGFKDEPAFEDGEYDRLYIISPDAEHHTYHMMRLRYGQKTYEGDKSEKGQM